MAGSGDMADASTPQAAGPPSLPFYAARDSATTSATMSGLRLIIISNTRTAGSGRRYPCSQSRNAVTARPNRSQKAGLLKPSFSRIARTSSEPGGRCTRAGSASPHTIANAFCIEAISSRPNPISSLICQSIAATK